MSGFFDLPGAPESPWNPNWQVVPSDEIGPKYFRNCIPNHLRDVEIFYDEKIWESVLFAPLTIRPEGVTRDSPSVWEDITMRLFLSTDGVKLLNLTQDANMGRPKDDEILMFIEGDDKDSLSGRVLRMKAGSKALKKLDIENEANGNIVLPINLTDDEFNLLVSSALHGKESLFWVTGFLAKKVLQTISFLGEVVADYILTPVSGFIKNNLRVSESYWKSDKIPDSDELMELIDGNIGKMEAFLQGILTNPEEILFSYIRDTYGMFIAESARSGRFLLSGLPAIPTLLFNDANPLFSYIRDNPIFGKIQGLIQDFKKAIKIVIDGTLDSVDLGFSMLIGVWNGLVDMVSGLLSLPGLFARGGEIGRDALKKITENPTFYFELMLEFMDNFIQAVTTIDWGAILQEFVKNYQALKYYLAFSLASLLDGKTKLDITIQEIGYYLGYVCFSVAELFFPYAKIGKIENASDLVKLMGNNAKTFAKSAGNAGKVTVQVIAKSFENFISFLRSGKKNFIELFKRIFKGLKEWVETTIAKYTLREFSPNTLKLLEGTNLYVRRIESTLETIGPGVVGAVVKRKNTYGLFEDSGKLVLEGSEIIISKAIKSEKVYTNGISTYIFGKGLAGKNINALFYKGRMVLRGTDSEISRAVTAFKKYNGKRIRIDLGLGNHSVIFEGREIYRGSKNLSDDLIGELNKVIEKGEKVSDEWLDAFDEISNLRSRLTWKPFSETYKSGSEDTVSIVYNSQKKSKFGASPSIGKFYKELGGFAKYIEKGTALVKKYHPQTNTPVFITHAEAIALVRASEAGLITNKMTLFIDRRPCGYCLPKQELEGLKGLCKSLGIDELTIYSSQSINPIKTITLK